MKRGRIKYLLDEKLNILRAIFLHHLHYFFALNIPGAVQYFKLRKIKNVLKANKGRK